MKKLSDIIKEVEVLEVIGNLEIPVSSLVLDSRKASKDSLFFAIKGEQADGHLFIDKAIENGATVIVCETFPPLLNVLSEKTGEILKIQRSRRTSVEMRERTEVRDRVSSEVQRRDLKNLGLPVTFIRVHDVNNAMACIASCYYDNPSQKIKLAGITGTNGKTTIATSLYNLFRISWRNEPKMLGGLYGDVNYLEIPSALSGVKARIFVLAGKWFPTGCHKVGASFGCLAPRLVTGQFDPTYHKAVWPSTGNYCRGGAYNSKLLSCYSIAILPEGMSRERFDWLKQIAGETIATPGTESNVKEIFDKTNEIRATRPDCLIFNQFDEMGNYMWHYNITGSAIAEAFESMRGEGLNFAGVCLTSGSAGSLGSGDYLKQRYPYSKIGVAEALQCPTILNNGYGAHRIEGIGDKHIPWVHNVRNTDIAVAIDDNDSMALLRLFNEPAGKAFLTGELGMAAEDVEALALMGISGISNMLASIKFAKYYELTEKDVVATILTDSVEMYLSRLEELRDPFNGTVGEAGIEPATSALSTRFAVKAFCKAYFSLLYQLSYSPPNSC